MHRPAKVLGAALVAACSLAGLTECLTFNGLVASEGDGGPAAGDDATTVVNPPGNDGGGDASLDAEGGVDLSGFPSYLSVDDAVKLCSRMFDCSGLSATLRYSTGIAFQDGNFSNCVDTFSGPLPPEVATFLPAQQKLLSCVLGATSCNAQLACFPYEVVAPGDPRCLDDAGNLSIDSCNGNDLLDCNQLDGGLVFHCGSTGFPDASFCSNEVGDCITSPTCADSMFGCNGTVLTGCDTGEDGGDYGYYGLDCAIYGQTCRPMGFNSDCFVGSVEGDGCGTGSPLASCPSDFDNTVQVCTQDSINLINCSELGATCTQLQSFAYCALAGATCTAFDANVNVCDASGNLSMCVRGQPVTYSCKNAGLTCAPDSDGQANGCR